jgi:hypothetical protein
VQGIIEARLDFKIAFVVRNRSLDLVEVDDIDIGIGSELLSLTMLPETFWMVSCENAATENHKGRLLNIS